MTKDKALDTRHVKVLVFDEADQMLDQDGFQDDSLRLWRDINKSGGNCQVLLFSATFSDKVKSFAMKTIPKANYIFVEKEQLSLDVIRQYQIVCPTTASKIDVLKDRIFPAAEKLGQSIIFVRTRGAASELHKSLEEDGFKCTSIQGGLTHEERDRVIKEFRAGETKILIATDVLARGFDQAQVTLVVNYDFPVKNTTSRHAYAEPDYETYLHRIGRSGRFGRKGAAFNLLVTEEDKRNLRKIEQHFNRIIPEVAWNNIDDIEKVLQDAGLA
jgi:ATP-dependent RNA helicase DDX19/DBP5